MRGGSRGSRGRYGTCGAAALIDLHGGASGEGGEGASSAKEMGGYGSMVMMRTGPAAFHTGRSGRAFGGGPLAELSLY